MSLRTNFTLIFSKKILILLYICGVLISAGVWWYFTDIRIMLGNYGKIHTYLDIFLSGITMLLFPFFIVAIGYKSWYFGSKGDQINQYTGIGVIGGIINTIISGASCCGATLATSFGLLPLMSFLPYSGLELKILGVFGLGYGVSHLLKNLTSCKIH